MQTHEELAALKLEAEITQIKAQTAWESDKARAEISEITRPFYHRPAFFAALVTVGGLVFTWGSGWFDAQQSKLEAEKKLLEVQVLELKKERSEFLSTETQFRAQKVDFDLAAARLVQLQSDLESLEFELGRRRQGLETESKQLSLDAASLAQDHANYCEEVEALARDRYDHLHELADFRELRKRLDQEHSELTRRLDDTKLRLPFELALGRLLSGSVSVDANDVKQLSDALESTGRLRDECIARLQSSLTPELQQERAFVICMLLYELTKDPKWPTLVIERLQAAPASQSSGYLIDVPALWGPELYAMIARAATASLLRGPLELGHWYGISAILKALAQPIISVLGNELTLDLAALARQHSMALGYDYEESLNVLEVIGVYPYFATVGSIVATRLTSAEEDQRIRLAGIVAKGNLVDGRPYSMDPGDWSKWLSGNAYASAWLEPGLRSLRTLEPDALKRFCGERHRLFSDFSSASPVPFDITRPVRQLSIGGEAAPPIEDGPSVSYQYSFTVEEMADYIVETVSEMDVVVALYSSLGLLAVDDDSGSDRNARLRSTLAPGIHHAIVYAYRRNAFSASRLIVSVQRAE